MLRQQINDAYKAAMRDRDAAAVSAMRMIMSALKDKDIEARPKGITAIPDDQILSMLQSMIKQRRESIALYQQGGREDLVEKESAEVAVIERFLPQQMDAAAMEAAIAAIIADIGAASIKDMGKVMAELKSRHAGAMDFQAASAAVKAKLQG